MKVEDRIKEVENNIIINLNMAEEESFARYYPYIKQYVEELQILKRAKRIRNSSKKYK